NLIFDINDFDETLPAPWEWDLKRLAASVEVAARSFAFKARDGEAAVLAAVRTYREKTASYSRMSALETWYQRIDFPELMKRVPRFRDRIRARKEIEKARHKTIPSHLLPSVSRSSKSTPRIPDGTTLVFQ